MAAGPICSHLVHEPEAAPQEETHERGMFSPPLQSKSERSLLHERVVDSRDVAVLVQKRHDHLFRDITGYIKIMEESTEPQIGVSDFFIKSTYKDSTGRTLPCYLLTKKGCDMVANKMTGEKGVLFTAARRVMLVTETYPEQLRIGGNNGTL